MEKEETRQENVEGTGWQTDRHEVDESVGEWAISKTICVTIVVKGSKYTTNKILFFPWVYHQKITFKTFTIILKRKQIQLIQ